MCLQIYIYIINIYIEYTPKLQPCVSHFSAASNSIFSLVSSFKVLWKPWSPFLFLPTVLLPIIPLLLLFISSDPHGHFLPGDVILNGHRGVTILTDSRGRGGGGASRRCWHSVEGDEADEDDDQRDEVECRELRRGRDDRFSVITWPRRRKEEVNYFMCDRWVVS